MRPVPNESKIPAGTLLVGKYRVTREIGRGGMAAVYEAEHMSLRKKVAVKVLASELSASTIVIERFFREARAAASVKSPYIVDVYDSGRLEDGRPFICMEMLEGESLYDRMARIRLIDPETTVRVISQCSKGLAKAHALGIVHRDLKPENIFLTLSEDGEETSKLLDFGLAKFYAPVAADEKTARLTREGAVFGTPAYMSPEQVKGQGSVDHRADLWALGCMAFECLIGRPVWNTDQGVAMTFAAIATAAIPTPSTFRPDLPESFDLWFKKALERDPDLRFQTAKELAEALQEAFGKPSSSLVDASERRRYAPPNSTSDLDAPTEIDPPILRVATPAIAMAPLDASGPSAPIDLPSPSMRRPPDTWEPRQDLAAALEGPDPAAPSRPVALSVADAPPTARNSHVTASSSVPLPPSPARWVLTSLGLVVASLAAFVVWSNVLSPQILTPIVQSTATTASSGGPAEASEPQLPPIEEPKWAVAIGEGQRLFTAGDVAGALRKFKDSQDMGGGVLAKVYAEQVKVAGAASGACKAVAFSHPRVGLNGAVGRPAVASVAKGAVVVWTDDHEQTSHDHAWSVVLDEVGKPTSKARDLTPEADEVVRPSLVTVGDRAALLYWDKSGREAGVHVRWIDADGRIGGASTLVGAPRSGAFWPTMDRSPEGFWVAWQDDRDREGDDLFLRKLSADLQPVGGEIRATDYGSINGRSAYVRVPSISVASNSLLVAYRLDREQQHLIMRMKIDLSSPDLARGIEDHVNLSPPPKASSPGVDRELGDVVLVNEDKLPADGPAIACGAEGCFIAWHGDRGGAYAAMIDAVKGKVLWRKRFADKGAHPSLAVGQDGAVAAAYFEGGRVKMAQLTRDGVSGASVIARVIGDQPRPWLAGGRAKGEWLLAWQDMESAHTEAYVARAVCRN